MRDFLLRTTFVLCFISGLQPLHAADLDLPKLIDGMSTFSLKIESQIKPKSPNKGKPQSQPEEKKVAPMTQAEVDHEVARIVGENKITIPTETAGTIKHCLVCDQERAPTAVESSPMSSEQTAPLEMIHSSLVNQGFHDLSMRDSDRSVSKEIYERGVHGKTWQSDSENTTVGVKATGKSIRAQIKFKTK